VEVDSCIHKVLGLRVNPNQRASPTPLQGGVARARVSMLGPVSAACTILSFHGTHDFVQGLGGGSGDL
jgi:hypothetical protein